MLVRITYVGGSLVVETQPWCPNTSKASYWAPRLFPTEENPWCLNSQYKTDTLARHFWCVIETYTCRDMKGWISLQLHAVTMMSIYLPDDQPWLCKSVVAGCASRWVEHHKYTMKEEPVCGCSNSRTGSQTGGRGLCVYVNAVGVVWWAWFVNVLVIVGRGFVYGWACFVWNLHTCL